MISGSTVSNETEKGRKLIKNMLISGLVLWASGLHPGRLFHEAGYSAGWWSFGLGAVIGQRRTGELSCSGFPAGMGGNGQGFGVSTTLASHTASGLLVGLSVVIYK